MGVLDGIKILELARVPPAEMPGMMFADMGADVLKAPEGQAIFKKLAAEADVIVEGFRPGVMKRRGADYETIRALNRSAS